MRSLGFALAVLVTASTASAGGNAAMAEALFREASDAFKDGRVAEACAKFAESQRLDPQRGTLANLARCHEREGKVATAWSDYLTLREQAKQAGDEPRVSFAQKRIDEIEPTLPKLLMTPEPGLAVRDVKVDGVVVGAAALGARLPIDQGAHTIVVETEDGRAWTQSFQASERETHVTLKAPPKEVTAPPPPPPPPTTDTNPRPWQRPLGISLAAVGGAGLVVGTVLGVLVVAKKSEVDSNCVGKVCNPIGYAAQSDAWGMSAGATVAFIAGAALLAGGAALFFTAPSNVSVRASYDGAMMEARW